MTRAASSAMTAVQDWFGRTFPNKIQPTGFLVAGKIERKEQRGSVRFGYVLIRFFFSLLTFFLAGASKRGWTTWTTAAVDTRVVAAVPIVMPIGEVFFGRF
jgi:hypothetical protein